MKINDLTVKEKVLRMVKRLPDDVTYDRVEYHLGVMKAVEAALAEAERGEFIEHDALFAELLNEETNGTTPVGASGKTQSKGDTKAHRTRRTASGGRFRKGTQGRGPKPKKVP